MAQLHDASETLFEIAPGTLLHLLSNSLVLGLVAAYLSPASVTSLTATSRAYRALLHGSPRLFRSLDLSRLKATDTAVLWLDPDLGGQTWRNVQVDESLTEEEFYSGPVRGVLGLVGRSGWLASVQTLILDSTPVTAELVHEILCSLDYNVRILSLRQAPLLNHGRLRQVLRTVCRPGRPAGTPRLKGLYVFGDKETDMSAEAVSVRALTRARVPPPDWYYSRGRVLPRPSQPAGSMFAPSGLPESASWANTLMDCRGVLAFDALLCNGPRHANSPAFGRVPGLAPLPQSIASTVPGGAGGGAGPDRRLAIFAFDLMAYALDGCASCGSSPEGWTVWDDTAAEQRDAVAGSVSRYPLLWPPPINSSSLRAAMRPDDAPSPPAGPANHHHSRPSPRRFIGRCEACLYGRRCENCGRWWCERCVSDSQLQRASEQDIAAAAAAAAAVALAATTNSTTTTTTTTPSSTTPANHPDSAKVRDAQCNVCGHWTRT